MTSRSVAAHSNKENVDSPMVASAKTAAMMDSAAGKTKKQSTRSPKTYSLLNGQKLRPCVPFPATCCCACNVAHTLLAALTVKPEISTRILLSTLKISSQRRSTSSSRSGTSTVSS